MGGEKWIFPSKDSQRALLRPTHHRLRGSPLEGDRKHRKARREQKSERIKADARCDAREALPSRSKGFNCRAYRQMAQENPRPRRPSSFNGQPQTAGDEPPCQNPSQETPQDENVHGGNHQNRKEGLEGHHSRVPRKSRMPRRISHITSPLSRLIVQPRQSTLPMLHWRCWYQSQRYQL